jgi:hypothetical protein
MSAPATTPRLPLARSAGSILGTSHFPRAAKRLSAAAGLLSLVLLGACANNPPPPDWAIQLQGHVERASTAELVGRSAVATSEWRGARTQVRSTGQPALAARVELLTCAVQAASLELKPCAGFEALRADAQAPELAYAAYLQGQRPTNIEALPEQHRAVAQAINANAPAAFPAERLPAEPLARLVAAAALLQARQLDAAGVAAAVEAASAQGWRKPLLAWLQVQQRVAQQAGNTTLAEQAGRRLQLLAQP